MKLKEVMSTDVEVVHPTDSLQTAAQKMRDRDIGFLPVVEAGQLLGVVTDRDLVLRTMATGMDMKTMLGRDMVTSPGLYVFDDQTVDEAGQIMRDHQIRRLVILNRKDGNVVGVVSLGDLATNTPSEEAGDVLKSVSSTGVVKPTR
jgi:CBS domain-containing protein